jgi:hypothetical protein
MWRMRIACWIPKATNTHTHSQYVILIALPLQQWLQERASVLRYMYIACRVSFVPSEVPPSLLLEYTIATSLKLNLYKTNTNHVKVTYKSIIGVFNLEG